jgi:cytochrome P450
VTAEARIRPLRPSDHAPVIAVIDEWWGGRPMAQMLPRLFFGIDTTWSAIGAALWHLARHPGDRRRLASDPGLMGTAVEEFLRAYAPVTMARLVAKDFDFHGHPLKEGDWLRAI